MLLASKEVGDSTRSVFGASLLNGNRNGKPYFARPDFCRVL
jgi:hypothetical protein